MKQDKKGKLEEYAPSSGAAPGEEPQAKPSPTALDCGESRIIGMLRGQSLTSYEAGYDCGKHGPNTTNCDVALFSTRESMKEWERGKRKGEQALNAAWKLTGGGN